MPSLHAPKSVKLQGTTFDTLTKFESTLPDGEEVFCWIPVSAKTLASFAIAHTGRQVIANTEYIKARVLVDDVQLVIRNPKHRTFLRENPCAVANGKVYEARSDHVLRYLQDCVSKRMFSDTVDVFLVKCSQVGSREHQYTAQIRLHTPGKKPKFCAVM